MEELLIFALMTATCLMTYLISYIFTGLSVIMFGIILMGIFLLQNNFMLLFIVFLMAGLLIVRILKLEGDKNLDF